MGLTLSLFVVAGSNFGLRITGTGSPPRARLKLPYEAKPRYDMVARFPAWWHLNTCQSRALATQQLGLTLFFFCCFYTYALQVLARHQGLGWRRPFRSSRGMIRMRDSLSNAASIDLVDEIQGGNNCGSRRCCLLLLYCVSTYYSYLLATTTMVGSAH